MAEIDVDLDPEALLALARDPRLAPERIRDVAQIAAGRFGFSCEIVEAAAGNPNSPPDLLLYLLAFHPCTVMHNPALALLMLAEPEFFARAHSYSLHRILSRADAPVFLCQWLTSHPDGSVATAARLHLHAASLSRRTWLQELKARLRPAARRMTLQGSELARAGLLPQALLENCREALKPPWPLAGAEPSSPKPVASAPKPGADHRTESRRERLQAARSSSSAPVLHELSGDRHAPVRAAVARNPNTPTAALERLAEDPSREVRRHVLANPRLPEAVLRRSLIHPTELTEGLGLAVLQNPCTPPDLITKLSQHPVFLCTYGTTLAFRMRAACHPNTPPDILMELASDSSVAVRYQVAHHPRLPSAATPILWSQALRSSTRAESPVCRAISLMHPELPGDLRERAVGEYDWLDRAVVALNPSLDVPHLQRLAEDGNRVVRSAARSRLAGEPPPDLWSSLRPRR